MRLNVESESQSGVGVMIGDSDEDSLNKSPDVQNQQTYRHRTN